MCRGVATLARITGRRLACVPRAGGGGGLDARWRTLPFASAAGGSCLSMYASAAGSKAWRTEGSS
eukprot:6734349-Prymnesium_polylepis.1